MASVLTPYRSSDGNNPYTTEQLKRVFADLEPATRAPGKYSIEERLKLQREFLTYIIAGQSATAASEKLKARSKLDPANWPYADYSVFMAWKAYDRDFAEAYEVAYAMGTDKLEDKAVEMAYGGNASMLQFVLKMRNKARYSGTDDRGTPGNPLEHVHTIKLIPVSAKQVADLRAKHEIDGELVDAR